jgi:hypothetical protein
MKTLASWVMIAGLIFSPALSLAYQNEPDGFREIKWQTPQTKIKGLKLIKKYDGIVEYAKSRENLDFAGIKATQILYRFVDQKLAGVTMQFEPCDRVKYNLLKVVLNAKFGEGKSIGGKEIFWTGETTHIKLDPYAKGAQIFFSDSREYSRYSKEISNFNAQLQKYWGSLLKDNAVGQAIRKLQLWLAKEGKDLVDSYYISPSGNQIAVIFKDGQTQTFYPAPLLSECAPESSKIYGVAEALKAVRAKPEKFKNKDIFLKACVINSVFGSGCESYLVLIDPEQIDRYVRGEKDVPLLDSGPTSSIPQEIFPTKCAVYRGHFFDPGLKPCQNNQLRFVVTAKLKEFE